MIFPKDLIASLGIDGLNKSAEDYYSRILDPTPLLAKPFAFLSETPAALYRIGILLHGLHIGKAMNVIDFGAGSCWLSRFLAEMQCYPIAVDVSASALRIGEKLFKEHPPIQAIIAPKFLLFDGHRLGLNDASVDRVICFDAFHHVPNRPEVLEELTRVLKPGGIMGFAEPGLGHFQSPQSQSEMRDFHVLEDSINPEELLHEAKRLGLSLTFAPITDLCLPVDYDYFMIPRKPSFDGSIVFFLTKGKYVPDSRIAEGLAHKMEVRKISPGKLLVRATNTGSARWLHLGQLGKVQVGAHLLDEKDKIANYDYVRVQLPRDIEPGETISLELNASGNLVIDMVSEGVSWFENFGSSPVRIEA